MMPRHAALVLTREVMRGKADMRSARRAMRSAFFAVVAMMFILSSIVHAAPR